MSAEIEHNRIVRRGGGGDDDDDDGDGNDLYCWCRCFLLALPLGLPVLPNNILIAGSVVSWILPQVDRSHGKGTTAARRRPTCNKKLID